MLRLVVFSACWFVRAALSKSCSSDISEAPVRLVAQSVDCLSRFDVLQGLAWFHVWGVSFCV